MFKIRYFHKRNKMSWMGNFSGCRLSHPLIYLLLSRIPGGVAWNCVQRWSTQFDPGGQRMYTSIVLLALSGLSPAADSPVATSWLTDYAQARKQGATDKKPVAVFLGSGKDGWTQLVRGGVLGVEQNQLLANNYVCVYADQATPEGKALARSLD